MGRRENQQDKDEHEMDGPEHPPSIKQALVAAKLFEKCFLFNQNYPTVSNI